jgi:superfamily II DNA or RNA helicase
MKRDLILRDYQVKVSDSVRLSDKDKNVMAIAPGGGKTETSIQIISDYLQENPDDKVLVLTHSTNVLLTNFYTRLEEINVGFTYSTNYDVNSQVHLTLPANEKKIYSAGCQYGLIVIDEAHEEYLATRVQRIIERLNPKKQILLTGTPSKFIGDDDFDVHFVAANEISEKWFAKLQIELVASNYEWVGNYNSDNEVTTRFNYTYEDTIETLNSVLDKLIHRLKTRLKPEEFNHPNFLAKIKSWAFAYKSLGKTLIYTKRTLQADMIYEILKDKGVNVGISHSKNDGDSTEIDAFKAGKYDVMVVVDRAKLGFNDVNLMNIIDMSGTHNIDMIYQIFCRVLRGGPEMSKYYLKVTPKRLENMALTHISTCGALMLTDREYISTYNGRNFNTFEIPVIRRRLPVERIEGDRRTRVRSQPEGGDTNEVTLPEFTMDTIDTFKDIIHDLKNPVSIYKTTTIGEVRYHFGYTKKRPPKTFEELLESARGNVELAE